MTPKSSSTISTNSSSGLLEMDLWGHLAELRKRLFIIALSVVVLAVASYSFSTQIFDFLNRPYFAVFPENSLIGTGPAEAFMIKIKVAIFSGIILALPLIFFQIWLFVAPGLHENEKKLALPFVFATTLLFFLGSWFCYQIVFPFAMQFFLDQYTSVGITPTVRLTEQLSLMTRTILAFGVMFELPVLCFILGRLGVINYRMMLSGFRYAIVIIFIVAAVLTPPDVITQFLLAIPLLLLYGISILVVKHTGKSTGTVVEEGAKVGE